jgi:hypothetical protein
MERRVVITTAAITMVAITEAVDITMAATMEAVTALL